MAGINPTGHGEGDAQPGRRDDRSSQQNQEYRRRTGLTDMIGFKGRKYVVLTNILNETKNYPVLKLLSVAFTARLGRTRLQPRHPAYLLLAESVRRPRTTGASPRRC